MQPALVRLQAGRAIDFIGSDGRLELVIPAGAITAGDIADVGGALYLRVRQVASPSGSSAGGSGLVSFGMYLIELVDAHGLQAPKGLERPVTMLLHVGTAGEAFDLGHAIVTVNRPLPAGVEAASAREQISGQGRSSADVVPGNLGPSSQQRAKVDASRGTLEASVPLATASTSASWDTNSSEAVFGSPEAATVDLSGGSLQLGIPFSLPAGPGNFTPQLGLAYSSAAVNEQHDPQGAAPWVGEGWNLSLGEISWTEHNVVSDCITSCTSATAWEDMWQLSDPFGTSAELIPPNINVATYYEDSSHSITPSPIAWHTAPETHMKIFSYTGPNALSGMSASPPCFRVWRPNGIMEEFGCTADSLQYYPTSSGKDQIANWFLDLITDPDGNQIHITYQRDLETAYGISYPRDVVLSTVEYDSPNCLNAQSACSGSGWAPLMRVSFSAGHSPAHLTQPLPSSGCNTGSNLRCDDPIDLSSSGGLGVPLVQSTFVLNDALVQTRSGAAASWNTLADYRLAFADNSPGIIVDPWTGANEYVAGSLLLEQVQVIGDDGNSILPKRTFAYSSQLQYYEDSAWTPNPSTNCPPWWYTSFGKCPLYAQSYDGNSYYLSDYTNGLGLDESFTWRLARNNTHPAGVASQDTDPMSCDGAESGGFPCDLADDETWSRVVLWQRSDTVERSSSAGGTVAVTSTVTYRFSFAAAPTVGTSGCQNCAYHMYWGDANDNDFLDYYNYRFTGFAQAEVDKPDGSYDIHRFVTTEGVGIYEAPSASNPTGCNNPIGCAVSPWWDLANVAHGREVKADYYDNSFQTPLLRQVLTQYHIQCPPSGVTGTPPSSQWGTFGGNLVGEVDHDNPIAACDVQVAQADTYDWDGASSSTAVPHSQTTYSYDSYGRLTSQTMTSNDGGATGSPTTIVQRTAYVANDSVSATATSATGTYLLTFPAYMDITTGSGAPTTCETYAYDGQGFTIGSTSNLTHGHATGMARYATSCGTGTIGSGLAGQLLATATYDAYGNAISSNDPDATAGNAAHTGCTVTGDSALHTVCTTYDTTYKVYPLSETNVLGQTSSVTYGAATSAAGGFGLWPISATDPNQQTTSYAYDAFGRRTSATLPGESSGLHTQSWTFMDWCGSSGAQAPCVEIDETDRLNSTTTSTTRRFYDGFDRLVETRTAAPGSQDVVQYAYYDESERLIFSSVPYFVPAYTGAAGSAAFAVPDSNQPGTSYYYLNPAAGQAYVGGYDGLGRPTIATDPQSSTTTISYTIVCGPTVAPGTTDTACYEQTAAVDPNGHQRASLADAFGRVAYGQRFTGSSTTTYAVYSTITYVYNAVGKPLQIIQPDGTHKTTYSYDAALRTVSMSDPDRGTEHYTYDANGNVVEVMDGRGASGTVFAGYDGLNRQLWHNTTNSSTGAYVTYGYDSTANSNYGVGRLTGESFNNGVGGSLSGSYTFSYDARGRVTQQALTLNGSGSYTVGTTYNDLDEPLSVDYPDGETVTASYTAQGWASGLTTQPSGGSTTTLVGNVSYTGVGGAMGAITGASLGNNTYTYSANYDGDGQLREQRYVRSSDGTQLFDEQLGYDGAGNITTIKTTLPQGTDTQVFCYDEQNRLTWAGNAGTVPCPATAAPSSFAPAYVQAYTYDTLDRLVTGPAGTYTYADAAHLHGVTATSGGYTATYDAAGNMICRAPAQVTICPAPGGGVDTGQQLTYDAQGRLATWQNAPSSPTATAAYLYDGAGNRVEQQSTSSTSQNTTTTTMVYVGTIEEVSSSACSGSNCPISPPPQTSTFYYMGPLRIAVGVNGTISYLASDHLGSPELSLSGTGIAQASVLYAPYGTVRYSSGTMPTDYGFTGQHSDANTSGLDYYGARYYDPTVGQFSSADTVASGPNRYAYVGGNPVNAVDPSGHRQDASGGGDYDPNVWGAVWPDWAQIGPNVWQTQYDDMTVTIYAYPNWYYVVYQPTDPFDFFVTSLVHTFASVVDVMFHITDTINDVGTILNGNASTGDRLKAAGSLVFNVVSDALFFTPVGEGADAAELGVDAVGTAADGGGLLSDAEEIATGLGDVGSLMGSRPPIFADTNLLVAASEGSSGAALGEIRAGLTYITQDVQQEFLNVATAAQQASRQQFLVSEGIQMFDGVQAASISQSPGFANVFQAVLGAGHSTADASLAGYAWGTGYEAVTTERRLYNLLTYTLPQLGVPIRRLIP